MITSNGLFLIINLFMYMFTKDESIFLVYNEKLTQHLKLKFL